MHGPWALGWEFVLALVTLLLAAGTGWLAWTTRKLARTTAEEVQGQTRPVLVPLRATYEAPEEGSDYYHRIVQLRNIGAGPALNVAARIGRGSTQEGGSDSIPAIAAGAESEIRVSGLRRQPDEGDNGYHMRSQLFAVEYFDLAGLCYTTNTTFGQRNADGTTGFGSLRISAGRPAWETGELGALWAENPLGLAKRQGLRGWSRYAFALSYHLLLDPSAAPRPLWPRIRETWQWLYPGHTRTPLQRLMWAQRAYKATLDKPVRPWARGPLRRPYVIARGLWWGYRVYRNLRF